MLKVNDVVVYDNKFCKVLVVASVSIVVDVDGVRTVVLPSMVDKTEETDIRIYRLKKALDRNKKIVGSKRGWKLRVEAERNMLILEAKIAELVKENEIKFQEEFVRI